MFLIMRKTLSECSTNFVGFKFAFTLDFVLVPLNCDFYQCIIWYLFLTFGSHSRGFYKVFKIVKTLVKSFQYKS